jgi:hypothetical protein
MSASLPGDGRYHVGFVPTRDSCTATNLTLYAGELEGELPLARPRQDDLELGETSGLRFNNDVAAVLLYDDVVAHRKAKSGTFARGLGREKGLNIFSLTSSGTPVPLSRRRISIVSPDEVNEIAR